MPTNDPDDYPIQPDRDAARHLARIARQYYNGNATAAEVDDAIKLWGERLQCSQCGVPGKDEKCLPSPCRACELRAAVTAERDRILDLFDTFDLPAKVERNLRWAIGIRATPDKGD